MGGERKGYFQDNKGNDMRPALVLAISSTALLSGCSTASWWPSSLFGDEKPATPQPVPVAEYASLGDALQRELSDVTPAEMGQCFRGGSSDGSSGHTYLVVNDKKSGKTCSVIIFRSPTGAFPPNHTLFVDKISEDACRLKVLSCARPAVATKIATQFKVKVDPVPFVGK